MKQGSITQKQFSQLEFPNLPYCHFNLVARKVDDYIRSFHYRNANTNVQLNVLWHKSDGTVTIARYDPKAEQEIKNILDRNEDFNQQILNEICEKYLG